MRPPRYHLKVVDFLNPWTWSSGELRTMRTTNARLKRFIVGLGVESCGHAVMAIRDGDVIGCFRYSMAGDQLAACGTWVEKRFRRRGIATAMWRLARKQKNPQQIFAQPVTPAGKGLLQALLDDFGAVVFGLGAA